MKNLIRILLILNLIYLSGCALGTLSVVKDIKISGEKVITIESENRPWVPVIAEKIEKFGFKVIKSGKIETRFILSIDAQAPTDWANRCFAGGWNFDYYRAELYDVVEKESLATVEGGGYSENCPPLVGQIFTKTANMVNSYWVEDSEIKQEYVEEIKEKTDSAGAKEFWDIVKDSNDSKKYEDFIKRFPDSSLAVVAKYRFEESKRNENKETVNKTSKKPAVVTPLSVLGEIKDSQQKIIYNQFLGVISNNYNLVPQEVYQKAEEVAFEEMDYNECTEEQCIRLIQDMLQVENMFQLQLIREDADTQIIVNYVDLDRKLVETDFCESCKTSELIKRINSMYESLEKKK